MRSKNEMRIAAQGRGVVEGKPFRGIILDVAFADKNQVELFAAIGRTKGPFQGLIDWPSLNELVTYRSETFLAANGESAWKEAGGSYGLDGKPTFSGKSVVAADIVQEVAAEFGGIIWTDKQGDGWAVSLVPVADRETKAYRGLAISWNGGGRVLDPLAREEYRRVVEEKIEELDPVNEAGTRHRLQQVVDRLWLYERAEQLLWAIHAAVLMQSKSVVMIPDVTLAEIIWGDATTWPANWRQNIGDILWSLSRLNVATLHIGKASWQPRFDMRSVAVAHVEHLETTHKQHGFCRSCCPLWKKPEHHGHFLIQIGYGFLGVLEHFAVNSVDEGLRQFDFRKPPENARQAIKAAQKEGALVPVHLPTKVFGPSAWSGLSRGQCGIMQAIVAEVTREAPKRKKARVDGAEIIVGNLVSAVHGKGQVVCPLLRADQRYVAFNGNGFRRGKGYLIVGRKQGGWLAKCGYLHGPAESCAATNLVPEFFHDLSVVAKIMGLTVVGIHPRTGQWLDLEQMQQLAQFSGGLDRLQEVHLRIYGPENYLDKWRHHLAAQGGFSAIPGEREAARTTQDDQPLLNDERLDLRVQMQQQGISQKELAEHLGVTSAFVSAVLNGKKQWSEEMRKQTESYVIARSTQPAMAEDQSGVVENQVAEPLLYSSA